MFVRRSGKLIKTTMNLVSAGGNVLTEVTTHVSNNGLVDGEYGRSVSVWEKQ